MKILTQNCWGVPKRNRRGRFDIIAGTIGNRPYDVVCLQEIFFSRWYKQSFAALEKYCHSYQKGVITMKGGLLTLTGQQPKEVAFHRYQVQGNLFSQQVTDAALGKGFLETIIEDEESQEELTIINVHNVSIYRPNHVQEMHLLAQSEQLFRHVKNKIENGRKIILAGDFNFERESMPYCAFAKLLDDSTSSLSSRWDFVFTNYGKADCAKKADYVTHRHCYPSDHPGIMVEVKL